MVRLTDIIKSASDEDSSEEEKHSQGDARLGKSKGQGEYSIKNVMGELRQSSGTFNRGSGPPEKKGLQLKGLLSRTQEAEQQEEEKKPTIPVSQIEGVYETMVNYVKYIFSKAKHNEKLSLNEGIKIIDFILKTPEALEILYGRAVCLKETKDLLFTNFVNVAIYALKIGQDMKFDYPKLVQLGLAGLVHDIGMAKVPERILVARQTKRLDGKDFDLLQQHPVYGAEVVKQFGPNYAWLAETVLQEHERENGKGYPQKLQGDQICEFARIIAVVDVYDALTSPRPRRKRFLPFEAAKEIVQSQRGFYWPKAVRQLLTSLSAFPAHSYVTLNSKAIARVVESNKIAPLRPKIVIVFDAQGSPQHDEKIIDLKKKPLLYIVGSIAQEDLPGQTKGT